LRVMPEATSRVPSARPERSVRSWVPTPARVRSLAARAWTGHRLFVIVLIPAVLLRADAELGYRWQAWFNDSFVYVEDTVHFNLDPVRVSGYSVFLKILEPFHSYALITILQHLMGLAVAVMIYALARHRYGAPAWLATLATVPVLYDGYEIELEHLILSDVPFLFVITLAVTLLLWDPDRLSTRRGAVIGLLLGLGVVLRSLGEPVLALVVLYMIIRRYSWRKTVAALAVGAVPALIYAGAFDLEHGQFAMSDATGVFLYSRVMTFAECSKMHVPADELWLCSTQPPDQRPIAQNQIWRSTGGTPLDRIGGTKFAPVPNKLAEDFAIRAIEAQPLDYAKAVADDTLRVFDWKRQVFPNAQTYDEYEFLAAPTPIPSWDDGHIGRYNSNTAAYAQANPLTQIVNPYAVIIRDYQKYVWLPGTIYGLILLAGLAGIAAAWRRLGGEALLPWAISLALIVVPAATAEFDYRYVLPAVPFACLAAVMAFSPGTAGRAGLERLVDAVRRTAGGKADGKAGSAPAFSGTARVPVAATGSDPSDAASAGAGDDEHDLATDGA
jgi:Dolichyl-phosphate-mannose-protein mannosyltransferase